MTRSKWSLAAVGAVLAGGSTLAQTADQFFDDTITHEIRLTMNPADWQRLKDNYRENIYYPCVFTWRGVTLENIGVRSAGAGSRNPQKPNFRADFNRFEEGQTFLGLKSVKIDGNAQDPTEIRERVTFAFARRMGLPASRTTHARVFLNNQYLGLYGITESVDKELVKRNFNEDDGYLYEYSYAFGWHFEYLGSDPAKYSPVLFEPKTHEKDPDPRPIEAFVRTVNQASDGDFERALAEYLDARQFLTHMAVEQYMSEVDGIIGDLGIANLYLYRFDHKNLNRFILWDKDNTFSSPTRDILRNANDNVLMRRLLAVPALRQFFLSELVRAATVAGGPGGWLEQEINRVWGLVSQALQEDPNKQCPVEDFKPGTALRLCGPNDGENTYQYLKQFAQQRADFVISAAYAAGFVPSGNTPVLSDGGAVNAAGSTPGLTAGSLASVYGRNIGTQTLRATSLPLPTELGGISVLIGGTPAPLLFVSPGQVNLQVPWEAQRGEVTIQALSEGVPGNIIRSTIFSAAPGIFVVARTDGSPVTTDRPAAASDVLIIYATGLGAVTNRQATGVAAPTDPLAFVDGVVAVQFGSVKAQEVFFAGLTPGFVGLYQINVRVPAGIPAGAETPLVVDVNGRVSAPTPIATR